MIEQSFSVNIFERFAVGYTNEEIGRLMAQLIRNKIKFQIVDYGEKILIEANSVIEFEPPEEVKAVLAIVEDMKSRFGVEEQKYDDVPTVPLPDDVPEFPEQVPSGVEAK